MFYKAITVQNYNQILRLGIVVHATDAQLEDVIGPAQAGFVPELGKNVLGTLHFSKENLTEDLIIHECVHASLALQTKTKRKCLAGVKLMKNTAVEERYVIMLTRLQRRVQTLLKKYIQSPT